MGKEKTLREQIGESLLIGGLAGLIYGTVFYFIDDTSILELFSTAIAFMLGWLSFDLIKHYVGKIKDRNTRNLVGGSLIAIFIVFAVMVFTKSYQSRNIDYTNASLVIGGDTLRGTDTLYYDRYTKEEIENLQIIYDEEINR